MGSVMENFDVRCKKCGADQSMNEDGTDGICPMVSWIDRDPNLGLRKVGFDCACGNKEFIVRRTEG